VGSSASLDALGKRKYPGNKTLARLGRRLVSILIDPKHEVSVKDECINSRCMT